MKKGIVAILILSIGAWVQAADIKAGEEKALVCTGCHGPGGLSANPEWPILAGQGAKYLAKQLHDFKNGTRASMIMYPQASLLSDEDIDNLAAYFAAQTPPVAATTGAGEKPEEMLALGEALYRGGDISNHIPACMACHGPTGAGIEPSAFPRLGGQHIQYNRTQLQAFQNAANAENLASDADKSTMLMRSNDPNGMMRDTAAKLTPKQIEAVAYYIRGLN